MFFYHQTHSSTSFETIEVKRNTRVKGHSIRVHVIVEPPIRTYSDNVVITCTYLELKARSFRVAVHIQNVIFRALTVPARAIVGKVSAANILPTIFATKKKAHIECRTTAVQSPNGNLAVMLDKIDLYGLE